MEKGAYYEEHAGLFTPGLPAIFKPYEICRNEQNDFLHWHEGTELFFGTGGTGWVFCDGAQIPLKKDGAVLVNSGQLHRAQADSERFTYEYLILEKELWEEIIPDFSVWFSCQAKEEDGRLKLLMEEAVRERERDSCYGWLGLKGQLFRIMSHLLEEYGLQTKEGAARIMNGRGRDGMQAALTYLKEHYRENLTVEQVSATAGFSKAHFSRMFKEMSGMTLTEYINMLRCDGVRRMLLTRNCTVLQAADLCGFTNRAHFYRMYRRYVGHLPTEEKRNREGQKGV